MNIKALISLGISIIAFGMTHITDKVGMNSGLDPWSFSIARVFTAALIVGAIWGQKAHTEHLKLRPHILRNLAVIGVGASGLVVLLGLFAMFYTTATNKGVMQGMYTAVTIIFAYFMVHERLPRLFIPIFAAMLIGLILLTTQGQLRLPNPGDWLLFLTIPIIGFTNAYAKKTMTGVQALTVSFGRLFFGILFLLCFLPFMTWEQWQTLALGFEWVLLSGVLSAIYIITFYESVELIGPTMAAAMMSIAPAFTAMIEWGFLEQHFTLVQIAGLALILGSAMLLTRLQVSYAVPPSD
ncbi:MAG: DMT family transporter [Candidatus Vecturithrix sp.]|jgi:drug/metabolite transporter (DMT)-like permease|nr:DMT family transporter [Candidatus Vecturithrix sp.]